MVKNTGDIFLLFSHFLEKCAVPYVVVGNTESYPERIGSDIDIVVPATDFKKIHMLVQKFAGEYCLQIVQCLQHEYCAFYFVLVFHGKGKNNGSVALDICSNYYRQGSPYIPARMLLQGRKHATNSHGQNKGFFVPAPAMEFLYYMVKKISKGPINNEQLTHLHDQFQQNPKHCIENMQLFWPAPVLVDVKLAIQNKDLQRLQELMLHLRKLLLRRCTPSPKDRIHELQRKIARFFKPTGLFMVMLGPDGAGKSSVVEEMIPQISPAFRDIHYTHLRPRLGMKKENGTAVTDPHGKPSRGLLGSIGKLFYFLFDYGAGYLVRTRLLQVKSTLVLYDRYYHDLLVDPKRYRYGAPMWLAKLFGKLIPKPDLVILLDAPPEVLQSRKKEVPFAETKRQRDAYLNLVRSMKNGVIIDASQPLEEVVASTSQKIFDFMETRTSERLKNLGGKN